MTEDVKPKRAYRSTRRAEQVAQTRRDILATAGALFRRLGYAGLSMPQIATLAALEPEAARDRLGEDMRAIARALREEGGGG